MSVLYIYTEIHIIPKIGFKLNSMTLKIIESCKFNDIREETKEYKKQLHNLINDADNCLPEFESFCIETFKEFKTRLLLSKAKNKLYLNWTNV
jgi:hypothetical protein